MDRGANINLILLNSLEKIREKQFELMEVHRVKFDQTELLTHVEKVVYLVRTSTDR
jgi:hypothetical protein